jgi:hypothetical protein
MLADKGGRNDAPSVGWIGVSDCRPRMIRACTQVTTGDVHVNRTVMRGVVPLWFEWDNLGPGLSDGERR